MYLYCKKRERFLNIVKLKQIIKFHTVYKCPDEPSLSDFIFEIWDLMLIHKHIVKKTRSSKPLPRKYKHILNRARKGC